MKRICSKCKLPILKAHRWHFVHRKFLFWTFTKTEHRDCARPTEIYKHVIRLKGEVPLPFMDATEVEFFDKTRFDQQLADAIHSDGANSLLTPEIIDSRYKKDVN